MELDEYLIDKYHRQIEKSSNFPHINSYILMITEMMFLQSQGILLFGKRNYVSLF